MSSVTWVSDESSMSMRTKLPVGTACSGRLSAMPSASAGESSSPICVSFTLMLAFSFSAAIQIQQLVVDLGRAVRLGLGTHAFAERVQRDQHSLVVQGFGHAQSVANLHPGHKARTHPPAKAVCFHKSCARVRFFERAIKAERKTGIRRSYGMSVLAGDLGVPSSFAQFAWCAR